MSSAETTTEDWFNPSDFYRTNDMAMVTFLKVEDHPVQKILWERGTCYWIFRISDALLDAIDSFTDREARIEPKEYNRVYGQTKKEFYDSAPDDHVTRH